LSRRPLVAIRGLAPLALLLAGCSTREPGEWASVREVTPEVLAAVAAGDASLAADRRGRVALTWVTGDAGGQDLWLALSADSGLTFSPPVRVNPRPGSVSSYAESRPLAAFGVAGELLIAWSERRLDSMLVADLVVRTSGDGGRTLGPPVIVNDDVADARPTFHGFPSLAPLPAGGWFAVWMDTREHAATGESATVASLFYALSHDGGQTWSDNRLLTARACACCRVSSASDPDGRVAVAYRSALDDVRDPALALSRDHGASFAHDTVLIADGWRLAGCPVDGPSLTMDDAEGGHYAWYTGAGTGEAWIAPWRSADGLSGLKRPLSDSLVSARRPRLARVGEATLITVEGRTREDRTRGVIGVRMLDPDGRLTPWLFLGADAADAWTAATGERTALVGWTERGDQGDRVRVVRVVRRGA
jgi:hypothetical protein